MKPFCEVMVQEIFPTVRALITREMKNLGYTQVEIAEMLHITQPAISQYERSLRGKNAELISSNERVMTLIKEAVRNLVHNKTNYAFMMCDICKVIREERILCKICKNVVVDGCTVCLTSCK